MPLTNQIIVKLNEITMSIHDKTNLTSDDISDIRSIFEELIKEGHMYNTDEIESWFKNEGSWTRKESIIRIINMANYVQDKHQQSSHLRLISDDDCC